MALPNTDLLDIPGRGLPAQGIYNLTTGPNIDTTTMDVPSRGVAAEWIQDVTVAEDTLLIASSVSSVAIRFQDFVIGY